LNVAGIGNDGVDTTNATEVTNLALTTTWTKYTITIPNPSALTANTGLFHFAEGSDEGVYTIWFDEITYTSSSGGGDCGGGDGGNGGGDPDPVAVVFDDDYGDGVSFAPFGGSVNDVTVDTAEAYSGTAALKVVVPAADYTGGAMVVNPGRDVSAYDTLTFWAKASAVHTLNVAGIGNDGVDTTNATEVTNLALTTEWQQFTITIPNPSALTANTGLFHFAEGSDEGVYTIWFDDIIYEVSGSGGSGGNGGGAEGNLAVNGAFDTGDFTGWAQYPSAQTTQTIVVDGTTSSNVARLFIPASAGGVNNVLKQERLLDGEGVFSAGDVIQISFDYRGEPGEGILFVKSICETAEPICGDKLHNNGGPFVPAGWTNYTDTFTLGAGVTGYTLEFAAVCGGTGTCVADYFIDNVSITIQ
jgi:hypothetical protein